MSKVITIDEMQQTLYHAEVTLPAELRDRLLEVANQLAGLLTQRYDGLLSRPARLDDEMVMVSFAPATPETPPPEPFTLFDPVGDWEMYR